MNEDLGVHLDELGYETRPGHQKTERAFVAL